MLNKIFILLNIFLFLVFYSYSYYLSSLVLASTYIFFQIYSSSISQKLVFVRLYYLVYLFSFPVNAVLIITEAGSRSHPRHWGDNNFLVNDLNFSYILILSFSIFILIISLYTIIEKVFSRSNKYIEKTSDSLKNFDQLITKNKLINLIKNNKFIFKIILIPIPFLLCYFMDSQGWGVHGVPAREENFFKLIGITIYTRNFILPIIILFAFILGIMGNKKISMFWFLWLILTSAYFGLSSLSRAVFVTYAGITLLICLVSFVPKNLSGYSHFLEKVYILNFKTIFSLFFFLFGFALLTNIRSDIILSNPDQMLLTEKHIAFDIFNKSYLAAIENIPIVFQYDYINLITGTIGRFLGFYELSSAAYYINDIPGYSMFVVNFLRFNPETVLGYITPRELTDSGQLGGVGVDIITNLYLCGPYIIFGLILISFLFLLQRIICNQLPVEIQNIVMFVFALLNIRYFIDGELFTQSAMTFIAFIIVITYKLFRKML